VFVEGHSITFELFGVPRHGGRLPFFPTQPGWISGVYQTGVTSDNPIVCRQEVFRWCMRYNTRRRHSWCNLLAPDDFEALTSATL
ncbi:hypothetical protein ACL1CL_14370, partial [Corynebacterium striatum]